MSATPNDCQLPETLQNYSRFLNLRGVRWRINLGILSSSSSSIEELRRAAADCRRRYASLRRCLLINPHLPKDGSKSPDLSMDNPLSQNPDSTWDRFFRNAELEKLLDQDLSRLYPEYENYFHSSGCQNMLRRVLLVWCLRHPEYGYRQGMHELLAPLLYVLHVDLQFLSQIRSLHEDCFNDEFDHSKVLEGDVTSNYRFTKDSRSNKNDDFQEDGNPKITTLDDLDPQTKELFLLSDAYGAEGELGVILSERFIEHDAYCMFDSLMIDSHGVVAMADFFSPSKVGASTNLPPVIEASSSLYHLLSIVDPSLHSHLIELGVEPQYFALRWLRVLFGREFSLDDLLLIWDELFSSSNASIVENAQECCYKLLCSPRGVFIAAMAVAMLLHLRSSLLATENATSCLQRLLNFPKNICVEKLILKAKSWQALALETNLASSNTSHDISKQEVGRLHYLPGKVNSPKTPSQYVPESYWEEKWRVMHKENASYKNSGSKLKKLLGDKFGLLRTESDPSPSNKDSRSSNVRRSILDDLTKVNDNLEFNKDKVLLEEDTEQSSAAGRLSDCTGDETCLSGESSSVFSTNNSPHSRENDHDNVSEKSSVTSNSFAADHDEEANQVEEITETSSVASFKDAIANAPNVVNEVLPKREEEIKQGVVVKDRKLLSGKLQWILRLGRGNAESTTEKGLPNIENIRKQNPNMHFESGLCGDSLKTDIGNKNVVSTIKNLGQSMLDNIQVIESVFQQDQGKGQAAAMAALMELRKISNVLLEM